MTRRKALLNTPLLADSIIERQIASEMRAVSDGVARYRRLANEAIERGEGATLKPAERLILHWFTPLVEAIELEQDECARGVPAKGRNTMGGIVQTIRADVQAYITLHQVVSTMLARPHGDTFIKVAYPVARAILAEAMIRTLKTERKEQLRELERKIKHVRPTHINRLTRKVLSDQVWGRKVLTQLGSRLLWILTNIAGTNAYDEDFVPAFEISTRQRGPKHKVKWFRLSDVAHQIIDDGHVTREHLRPRYRPMLHCPVTWRPDQEGGYDQIRTPIISKITPGQRAALDRSDLERFFPYLNTINQTSFCVNEPILKIVTALWEQGGNELSIPPRDPMPLPPRPHNIDEDEEVKKAWKREASAIKRANIKLLGERKTFMLALQSATDYADEPAIWFPHQFDFRTRAYPIPAAFNHQGPDPHRGMLLFANAVDPGKAGRRWLMIHAASCYGLDKASYEERLDWAAQTLDSSPATPDEALERQDWRQAENPFQYLAACFAWHDPELAARLPVQIDGSCNGLQHYAGIMRDEKTAAAVNLIDHDRPARIYHQIRDAVLAKVDDDVANGTDRVSHIRHLLDLDFFKHNVMTTTYGVTPRGARGQLSTRLRKKHGYTAEDRYDLAGYLSRYSMAAMREECPLAVAAMDWLKECAEAITHHNAKNPKHSPAPVEWTTPLGFIVHQPYMKLTPYQVNTVVGKLTLRIEYGDLDVNPVKQIRGIAPNFIHSVDGSHMLSTAQACADAGIDFAAVHDAYWSHAAHTDRMGSILRRTFVDQHRVPLLQKLVTEWRERYPYADIPSPPPIGSFDIDHVLKARYFFN